MASATGRAGSALRSLTGFGLAAGAGIGVATGAVALLTKSLNESGREAQALQTLSVRGIDTDAYQRAASAMGVLTGNTQASRAAMLSAANSALSIAGRLKADPGSISTAEHRAAPILGFDNIQDFADSRHDIENMMQTIREQWAGANQDQRLAMRWASDQLGIQESMIDAIAEQNGLYEKQAAMLRQVNAGNKGAVGELKKVDAQIARINSGLGVMTPAQISAAERYDESAQILKQFGKDLRTNAAVATVDAFDFIQNPRRAYREGREREGQRSPLQDLGGVSQEESRDAYRAASDAQRGRVPGYAQGGVVPGPTGRPQLAMVHGGERVVPAGERSAYERRAYDQSVMHLNNDNRRTEDRRAYDQSVMHLNNDNRRTEDRRAYDQSVMHLNNDNRQSFDETVNRIFAPTAHNDRSTQNYDQRRQATDRSDRRSVGPINNYITIEGTAMEPLAQAALDTINRALATGVAW